MSLERPRLHCHSAFKHYQMYHRDCGSSYGNSVFTTTYNINGGQICGGGFWGGVWGGIGMGIGNFLGSLLGGCFGGGFGGFSPFGGGMMASPFSLMGNSYLFNPTNFWNIGNKDKADGAGGKDKEVKEKNETVTVEKTDKDQALDNGFRDRVKALKESKDTTEAVKLYNEIIAKIKEPEDDINKKENIEAYKKTLNSLKDLFDFTSKENKPDSEAESATLKEKPVAPSNTSSLTVQEPEPVPAPEPDDKLDLTKLSVKNPNDLQTIIDNIDNIDAHTAQTILGDRCNKTKKTVKVPRNYAELLLAHKTGFDIQFCKNTDQEGKTKKSSTIKGKIDGPIEKVGNDEIYKFKVKDRGTYTLVMNFTENNKNITIGEVENPEIEYEENGETKQAKLQNRLKDFSYDIGEEWATRTGDSAFYN